MDGTVSCMTRRIPCPDRRDDDELHTLRQGSAPNVNTAYSTVRCIALADDSVVHHYSARALGSFWPISSNMATIDSGCGTK